MYSLTELEKDIKDIINNYVTDGFVNKKSMFEEIFECLEQLELKDEE